MIKYVYINKLKLKISRNSPTCLKLVELESRPLLLLAWIILIMSPSPDGDKLPLSTSPWGLLLRSEWLLLARILLLRTVFVRRGVEEDGESIKARRRCGLGVDGNTLPCSSDRSGWYEKRTYFGLARLFLAIHWGASWSNTLHNRRSVLGRLSAYLRSDHDVIRNLETGKEKRGNCVQGYQLLMQVRPEPLWPITVKKVCERRHYISQSL